MTHATVTKGSKNPIPDYSLHRCSTKSYDGTLMQSQQSVSIKDAMLIEVLTIAAEITQVTVKKNPNPGNHLSTKPPYQSDYRHR